MDKFLQEFFSAHDPSYLKVWQTAKVGIAGAGGLGSNIAVSLTRAGIGKLIIADFDVVSISNLNRQQYYLDQVGKLKVDALLDNLHRINPDAVVEVLPLRLDPYNIPSLFQDVDIMIEAFDSADQKQMLIETWIEHFPNKFIIIASGLAGIGNFDLLKITRFDNVFVCGDNVTELTQNISPVAPRVAIVANMQANLCLELLVNMDY